LTLFVSQLENLECFDSNSDHSKFILMIVRGQQTLMMAFLCSPTTHCVTVTRYQYSRTVLVAPYVSTGTSACRPLSLLVYLAVLRNKHRSKRSSCFQAESKQLADNRYTTSQLIVGAYYVCVISYVYSLAPTSASPQPSSLVLPSSPRTSLPELASALLVYVVPLPGALI
jgi:hypothetical protein